MTEVIIFLRRVLSATVADWNADNFEESKVKRAKNGRFASGGSNGSSSAAKPTLKEIYTSNKEKLMDFMKGLRAASHFLEASAEPFAYDEYDRERYINHARVMMNEKYTDAVLAEVEKLNKDGVIAKATVEKSGFGEHNNVVRIEIFNKNMIDNYIEDASKMIWETHLDKKVKDSQKSYEQAETKNLPSVDVQIEDEKTMLEEIKGGQQSGHFLGYGYSSPLLFSDYLDTLKENGITDQEIALTYLFTTNPTSIRMGGSCPNEIFEPERGLCQELADTLEGYIEKAPKWKGGTLYRGCHLSDEVFNKMRNEGVVDMRGISSWSSEGSVAEDFANNNEDGELENEKPYVFRLSNTDHGTSIAAFSYYPTEAEVMMSNKVTFKIHKIQEENGITYVDVEEFVKKS